jgi:hypothetical protein
MQGGFMAVDIVDGTTVVAAKDQFSCPLGDAIVVLDVKAGLYYSLDNVGAVVWQLVQQPRTVGEIRQAIVAQFEVAPEICQPDLAALLQDLAARNLVEIRNGADS